MADFIAVTASSGPRLKDAAAVQPIIDGYSVDPDLHLGVEADPATGEAHLFLYGYVWPEAWPVPAGVVPEDFNPYDDEHYEAGAEGFTQLLRALVPHLKEPLTVHAVGFIRCRFPLAACEWHVEPGIPEVAINEFQHGPPETVVVVIPPAEAPGDPDKGGSPDGRCPDSLAVNASQASLPMP